MMNLLRRRLEVNSNSEDNGMANHSREGSALVEVIELLEHRILSYEDTTDFSFSEYIIFYCVSM